MTDFSKNYGKFQISAPPLGNLRRFDGYTVVYVPFKAGYGGVRMENLADTFASIEPDVVQTLSQTGWTPIVAALLQRRFKYLMFTGNHTTASVYPLVLGNASPPHRKTFQTIVR